MHQLYEAKLYLICGFQFIFVQFYSTPLNLFCSIVLLLVYILLITDAFMQSLAYILLFILNKVVSAMKILSQNF